MRTTYRTLRTNVGSWRQVAKRPIQLRSWNKDFDPMQSLTSNYSRGARCQVTCSVDNPPKRYSRWVSADRFGGSVIHSWIYRPAEGCKGIGNSFEDSQSRRRHAQFISRQQYIYYISQSSKPTGDWIQHDRQVTPLPWLTLAV
jgi:hypothetical protein